MAELTNAEIDAAIVRGDADQSHEPRATAARYDKASDRIVIELTNGASVAIPPRLLQGLAAATIAEIAEVSVQGRGYGLHWKSLDVDLSVPGLLAGVFGTTSHMARKAGQAKSRVKAAAARRNGAKGGRPKKSKAA